MFVRPDTITLEVKYLGEEVDVRHHASTTFDLDHVRTWWANVCKEQQCASHVDVENGYTYIGQSCMPVNHPELQLRSEVWSNGIKLAIAHKPTPRAALPSSSSSKVQGSPGDNGFEAEDALTKAYGNANISPDCETAADHITTSKTDSRQASHTTLSPGSTQKAHHIGYRDHSITCV